MLKIRQASASTFVAEVLDRDGKIVVSTVRNSEAECYAFFSHLSASLDEGFRNGVVRE